MPAIPVVLLILKPATCYLCRNVWVCVVAKVENDMGTHNATFLIHVSFKVHIIDIFIIYTTTISMTFGILHPDSP